MYSMPIEQHNALIGAMLRERSIEWINTSDGRPPTNAIRKVIIEKACASIGSEPARITEIRQLDAVHGVGGVLSEKVIQIFNQ
jgi:hypothetical protein